MEDIYDSHTYVFISYAHRDSDIVLPMIKDMRNAGIVLWYDDGIEAGTEWPEYIAKKLISCDRMVVMLTDNYVASHNCTRELNLAIAENKPIMTVYLKEKIELSPGYRMQLGTTQGIFRHKFSSRSDFIDSLTSARFFRDCKVDMNQYTVNARGELVLRLEEDEDGNIVTLLSAKGEEIDFVEIADIAFEGKFYAILQPVEPLDGMDEDEALIFLVQRGGDGGDRFEIVLDDRIIDAVFAIYGQLYDEANG